MYKLIIPMVAIILSACNSTKSVNNIDVCTNNWTDTGYETATSGKSVRYFDVIKEKCGNKLPEQAKSDYLGGFTVGIKEYCTYENGHELASKSLPNQNTCPFELKEPFEKGYKVAALAQKKHKSMLRKMQDAQKFYNNNASKKAVD